MAIWFQEIIAVVSVLVFVTSMLVLTTAGAALLA